MRLQYPSGIRIICLPCTGKVDLIHLLRSFEKGADGVYVVGCGDRVQMFNLASSEAPRFVEIAEEMTRKILALGPNPIRTARKMVAA